MTVKTYQAEGRTIYTIAHEGEDLNAQGEPCTTPSELLEFIEELLSVRGITAEEAASLREQAAAL